MLFSLLVFLFFKVGSGRELVPEKRTFFKTDPMVVSLGDNCLKLSGNGDLTKPWLRQ